jgi:prophage regulatory protein
MKLIAGNLFAGTAKLLSQRELKEQKGIPFSRQHIHRLVKAGRFPAPIKVGDATNAWIESEIDAWFASKIVERDRSRRGSSDDPDLARSRLMGKTRRTE